MRLSSGPEHSLLTNRPVIVTQSDPPSSSPLPLQQRGSPYSPRLPARDCESLAKVRCSTRVRWGVLLELSFADIACLAFNYSRSLEAFGQIQPAPLALVIH